MDELIFAGLVLDKIFFCSQFNFYQRLLIEFSSPFIISNCFPFSCFRLFFHFGLIERESNYGVVLINMELYLFLRGNTYRISSGIRFLG